MHPLFETRGPPGTHDVPALAAALDGLLESKAVPVPRFDKGLDDRAGERRLEGPFDLIVLEGWCVGAAPVARDALEVPINALEREVDPDAAWRRHANDCLAGAYAALWRRLDALVFLEVPDLAAVRRWRLQQEAERAPSQRLDEAGVARFVEHYERITRAMLEDLPERCDWRVAFDTTHRIVDVARRAH